MSKSSTDRKHGRNPDKGYPKRVAEKYGHPNQGRAALTANPTHTGAEEALPVEASVAPIENDTGAIQASALTPAANAPYGPQEAAPASGDTPFEGPDESAMQDLTAPGSDGSLACGGKGEKRSELQNIAEFIRAFFDGKIKTLSNAAVKRFSDTSVVIEPALRGQLLRHAQVADRSLDKTRKLMLLAKESRSHKSLSFQLFAFCADCVLLNPLVCSQGMKALLFPGFDDATRLDDAWHALQSLRAAEAHGSAPQSPADGVSALPDAERSTEAAVDLPRPSPTADGENDKSLSAKAIVGRTHRNALLCSAIWRMHHGQASFGETMRALRATVFALPARPKSLEGELFEALATLPEKEDERFAYVLEWSARQQIEAQHKLSDASKAAEQWQLRALAVETQCDAANERANTLERQLEAERAARAASEKAVGVAQTHGQADLEEMCALSLIAIRDAIAQLDVVSVALGREYPKIESARDKVHAVMDALKPTNTKLEDA